MPYSGSLLGEGGGCPGVGYHPQGLGIWQLGYAEVRVWPLPRLVPILLECFLV